MSTEVAPQLCTISLQNLCRELATIDVVEGGRDTVVTVS